MEMLEEENDELWDQFAMMVQHITEVEDKIEGKSNGNSDSED
jgi:hypothetical protein